MVELACVEHQGSTCNLQRHEHHVEALPCQLLGDRFADACAAGNTLALLHATDPALATQRLLATAAHTHVSLLVLVSRIAKAWRGNSEYARTAAGAGDERPLRIVPLLQVPPLAQPQHRVVQQVRQEDDRQHHPRYGAQERHGAAAVSSCTADQVATGSCLSKQPCATSAAVRSNGRNAQRLDTPVGGLDHVLEQQNGSAPRSDHTATP